MPGRDAHTGSDAWHAEASQEGSGVRFRRATERDRDQIARLHHKCSQVQPGGFMHKLGLLFFRCYYHLLMPDPNTIVISAEDNAGRMLGFVAGCSDARMEMERLQRYRIVLLLSCLTHLLRTPSLVRDLYARMRFLDSSQPESWGGRNESRISFWCWEPESAASRQSTMLLQHFLEFMRKSGVKVVRFEVDRINRKVEITHRLMGARTVRIIQMPDGRERLVMEHVLN